MPLVKNKLLTKARGVAMPRVQQVLADLKQDKDKVNRIALDGLEVVMHTAKQSNVELGVLKPEYHTFVESLHRPVISYQVTGGYYVLTDNKSKKTIRQFGSTDELSQVECDLLFRGEYSYRQTYYGMNLEIIDEG